MGTRSEEVTEIISVGDPKVVIMLGQINSTRATMARQQVGIRSEMHALRITLAKHADGRTTRWKALGRSLDRLMELWNKYDDL